MGLTLAIGLATGCVYALVALGYSVIYRTTGVVNFAQGGYVMVGGFVTWWLLATAKLPYALAVAGGISAAALLGLLLWMAVVLPLWRRRSPAYVVLLQTILFGAILTNAALLVFGSMPQTLPSWLPFSDVQFGGNHLSSQYLVVAPVSACLVYGFHLLLKHSMLGRAMRACAASRDTAQLIGVHPERVGGLAFALTAAIGGLGGAIIAPAQFTSVEVGLTYGIFGFVAAVLGGFGSLWGALAGGIALGVVNAFVGRYISSSYQIVIAFGLLLALLAFRPQGLFGQHWEEA
jgi:branched-chain amino acid transport system permease protein